MKETNPNEFKDIITLSLMYFEAFFLSTISHSQMPLAKLLREHTIGTQTVIEPSQVPSGVSHNLALNVCNTGEAGL